MIAARSMITRQRQFRTPGVLRRLPPRSPAFALFAAHRAARFE